MAQEAGGSLGVVEIDREQYERLWDDYVPPSAEWYCLRIEAWTCGNCGTEFSHHTCPGKNGEHWIVVWPTVSDPNMYAVIAERDGKAAIVPYTKSLGPSLSYYAIQPS